MSAISYAVVFSFALGIFAQAQTKNTHLSSESRAADEWKRFDIVIASSTKEEIAKRAPSKVIRLNNEDLTKPLARDSMAQKILSILPPARPDWVYEVKIWISKTSIVVSRGFESEYDRVDTEVFLIDSDTLKIRSGPKLLDNRNARRVLSVSDKNANGKPELEVESSVFCDEEPCPKPTREIMEFDGKDLRKLK